MKVTQAIVCPSCGARMRDYRQHCLRCEAPLPPPAARPVVEKPRSGLLEPRVALPVMAGLLLVVAGIVLVQRTSSTSVPAQPPRTSRPWLRIVERAAKPAPNRATAPVPDPAPMARIAYQGGDYRAAFDRFLEATQRNPRDAEALSNCGQMLVRLNRVVEALPYFQRAIELNSGRWAYRFNLGHAYGELGQWERALEQYRAATTLFPDDFATEYNLGMALHKRGDEAAAAERFRRAIALQPSEPDFHLALGISSDRLGRFVDASEAYRRYLELAPGAPRSPAVRARVDMLGKMTP